MEATVARRGVAAALGGLFLAAVTSRPQLVGIGPLLGRVQSDLGVSHAAVAVLGAIPVLCMGVFAPVGPRVLARLGAAAGVSLCIALIAFGGLARSLAGGFPAIIALTVVIGLGMGLLGSAMPVVVAQVALTGRTMATGLYVSGINVGSALSSAAAVPLAGAGGWRRAMAVMSIASIALLVCWRVLAGRAGLRGRPAPAPRPPLSSGLRDPRSWLLVGMFTVFAVCFYGTVSWLADAYQERGWSAASAGALVAALNLASLPGALVTPWLAERYGTRRGQILCVAAMFAVGLVLLAGVPELAWPGAILTGFANGGLFALVMVLPIDLAADSSEVGVLAGVMLGAGYTLAAAAPVLLGALRDSTGSFSADLWLLAGASLCLLGLATRVGRAERRAEAAA